MSDITEVKRALAMQAEVVAAYLLPNGRRDGHEWRAGSVHGDPGQSLGVHLHGAKAGVWSDFNGGTSGDLIDLWCAAKRMTIVEALDDARKWLGLERPKFLRERERKTYTRPPKPRCNVPKARVLDYLTVERNLPSEVLEIYRIGEDGDRIVFPFLLPDGVLAMAKTREAKDGAKPKPTAADCEPVLFGWQSIQDHARAVAITEGEIDALSLAAYGIPALSVPFGGGGGAKQQWIENDFERLERFEVIYLALDMDEPGEQAAEAIADRLGRHRCLRVRLPRKDANECLVDGVTALEIDKCFAEAKNLDPDGLKRASDYTADVVALFWPQPGQRVGYATPYRKLTGKLMFRPGDLTIWTGATGAGKSQVLSDCAVDWTHQDSRVCIASLEMLPSQTLKRMVKQTMGSDRPPAAAIERALRWLDRGVLIYDRVGKAGLDEILPVFDYARAKYGCDQFVIDSLMRLGIAGDDYNGQDKLINRLVDWTLGNRVHTHLVAHARKGEKGQGPAAAEDVKGASELSNNAANIVSIWRNRDLEQQAQAAESDEQRERLLERPPVVLNVAKQRNGDWEGRAGLWFRQDCYQYRSSEDDARFPRAYLRDDDEGEGRAA
jgi:twinkle protein